MNERIRSQRGFHPGYQSWCCSGRFGLGGEGESRRVGGKEGGEGKDGGRTRRRTG